MAEAKGNMERLPGLRLDKAGGDRVRLALAPPRAMLNLRGRPGDAHFVSGVREVVGVDLPEAPNRWNGNEDTVILWLGPDEWLAMVPEGQADDIDRRLRDAIADDPWFSVVDVSHNYAGFELSGPAVRDVLAKGCPLDLHPRSFGRGDCAQTLLAKARVLLRATVRDNHIEIWLRNSFARYAATWLLDAMEEFEGQKA